MFVTTPRASAWLDQPSSSEEGRPARQAARHGNEVRVLYADRPFEAPAGRCIALKLVSPVGARSTSARLFVLLASRYERVPQLRWVRVDDVLSDADAARWAKDGFGR